MTITLPNPSHKERGYGVLLLPFAGEGGGEGEGCGRILHCGQDLLELIQGDELFD